MATILYIGVEPSTQSQVQTVLAELGHQSVLATSMREGLRKLLWSPVDLVVSNSRMPDGTGLDLLDALRGRAIGIPVIVLTDRPSLQHAIISMQSGAVDYLVEPLDPETVCTSVTRALEVASLPRPCMKPGTRSAPGLRDATNLRPPSGLSIGCQASGS